MRLPDSAGGRRARSATLLAPAILALAVLATACGGSTKSGSAATTTTTRAGGGGGGGANSFAAARSKFTSCLEAHGVPASEATRGFGGRRGAGPSGASPSSTTPSSPSPTPPTTNAAFGAAFAACRSDLPGGFGGGGFQNSAAGRAYLQCLQLHGVTIPSTPSSSVPGGSTSGTRPNPGSFASNPNFQKARAACAPLAPSRTGSTTTQPGAA